MNERRAMKWISILAFVGAIALGVATTRQAWAPPSGDYDTGGSNGGRDDPGSRGRDSGGESSWRFERLEPGHPDWPYDRNGHYIGFGAGRNGTTSASNMGDRGYAGSSPGSGSSKDQ